MTGRIDVHVEAGPKKVFATALAWPGWSRSGPDESRALAALMHYGARYARAIAAAGVAFTAPGRLDVLDVVERAAGNATTDFGVPARAPSGDTEPLEEPELARWLALLGRAGGPSTMPPRRPRGRRCAPARAAAAETWRGCAST